MGLFHKVMQKYDAPTLFLCVATISVIAELFIMRTFLPNASFEEENETEALMEQVCTGENLAEATEELEVWDQQATNLSKRLSRTPSQWQKPLVTKFAFGEVAEQETPKHDDPRYQFLAAANYAENNLFLQSIMTGKIMLANINGSIYKVGDDISMRGGEIVMNIVELGSTFAIVQLANHDYEGDTQRTIYLPNTPNIASGERTP